MVQDEGLPELFLGLRAHQSHFALPLLLSSLPLLASMSSLSSSVEHWYPQELSVKSPCREGGSFLAGQKANVCSTSYSQW